MCSQRENMPRLNQIGRFRFYRWSRLRQLQSKR
ncbi:Uncharacterised protein [Vibrio cholerae]|nr:Uncharacterised protein [Vibrio cholerae]